MPYLDNAATTSVSESVLEAMRPYLTSEYGNPSSIHSDGRRVRKAVDEARALIADAIGAVPEEIYFTSGGSESDNLAIKGSAFASTRRKIVTSEIEHPAVLRSCEWLGRFGFNVVKLPVDQSGVVDIRAANEEIDDDTCLVTVMLANNEIGTIQPIEAIAQMAKAHGTLMHTDAVQAVGAIPIDVAKLGVDMLSMSGHKLHAPKGIGALYIRKGVTIEPLIHGGGQERGMRSGTENVAGIVGLGAAIKEAVRGMEQNAQRMNELKTLLLYNLTKYGIKYKINGTADKYSRLPNNINISLPNTDCDNLPMWLDYAGISCSSGSACSAGKAKASHVLTAIGCTEREKRTSLRITLGQDTTEADIAKLVAALEEIGGGKNGRF